MFKIERGSKYRKNYRKMDCFRKYSIIFFKIEKTQNRSSFVVKKQFYISPAVVSGANKP